MNTRDGKGFAWDDFDVYLFDIDGTLLHCEDAVHYFAFCDALSAIAGRPVNLDGVTAHGNTDTGILRDAFALAGVPESDWRPSMPEICQRMTSFVDAHKNEFRIRTLPLIRETLMRLRSAGKLLGAATGNLESIGIQKLSAAGLLRLFHFAAWSDGLEHRAAVFANAIRRAQSLAGKHARIVAIGDTPADVRAAHQNGLPAIAVATGIYGFEQLQGEAPEFCIQSFEDPAIPA